MVFQSLLSTVSAAAGAVPGTSLKVGSGIGGGSPPEGAGASLMGRDKHCMIGSARTFDDLLPHNEQRANRRAGCDGDEPCTRAGGSSAPTFGWWRWHQVEVSQAGEESRGRPGATLLAMEQSLTSLENGANEKLNHWQHAEEVKPLFRSEERTYGTNYGTFTRRDFLYSGSARVDTPTVEASAARAGNREVAACVGKCAAGSAHGTGAQTGGFLEHALRPGDTLSALAVRYNVQVSDISRANGLSGMGSSSSLLVRKSLRIPVLAAATPRQNSPARADALPLPAPSPAPSSALAVKEQRKKDGGSGKACCAAGVEAAGYQSSVGGDAGAVLSQRAKRVRDPIASRLSQVTTASLQPTAPVPVPCEVSADAEA